MKKGMTAAEDILDRAFGPHADDHEAVEADRWGDETKLGHFHHDDPEPAGLAGLAQPEGGVGGADVGAAVEGDDGGVGRIWPMNMLSTA